MYLDVFLRVIPKLAEEINRDEDNMVNGLHSVYSQYFEPLYKNIMKKVFFEEARRLSGERLEDSEMMLLKDHYDGLKEIYRTYFSSERNEGVNNPHIFEQVCIERFSHFNQSFGIVPRFIEKGRVQ